MLTFSAVQLERVTESIFYGTGVPEATAAQVAASLVESNLVGHDSHGVIRILSYVRDVETHKVDPLAEWELLSETPTTALIDAHWMFGQLAAAAGMSLAIKKAQQSGVAAVALRQCYHIGRLGEWAMMAADAGMIGLVMCNSSPSAAAHGGICRVLSTNPIACAVPAGKRAPFLMDLATTTVAEGKLKMAVAKGDAIASGTIVDKAGRPTTNPQDFYDGGALLPFGGHKGYALSLLVDLLCGALTGHGCTSLPEYKGGNGVFMAAISVETFCPREQFLDTVDRLFSSVTSGPVAPGFDEILIPGEPEQRSKVRRLKDGIPVPESTWEQILQIAQKYGIDVAALL